jgi:hypothetical protein
MDPESQQELNEALEAGRAAVAAGDVVAESEAWRKAAEVFEYLENTALRKIYADMAERAAEPVVNMAHVGP